MDSEQHAHLNQANSHLLKSVDFAYGSTFFSSVGSPSLSIKGWFGGSCVAAGDLLINCAGSCSAFAYQPKQNNNLSLCDAIKALDL